MVFSVVLSLAGVLPWTSQVAMPASHSAVESRAAAQTAQRLPSVTDRESYAIYAVLVPVSASTPEQGLVLQQETDPSPRCHFSGELPSGEWQAVEADFNRQNGKVRRLLAWLPLAVPYRFVTRAQIQAHQARQARKYPGQRQHRPGDMEYVAVSAVGFNRNKTKAMVHVHNPRSGGTYMMELRDGKRVAVAGCRWAA